MRQFYWRLSGVFGFVIATVAVAMAVGAVLPGGTIAFESDRLGNIEIFLVDTNRRLLLNVTDHPGQDTNPAWSPDGTQLAFETIGSAREPRASVLGGGGKAVYVVDMHNRVQLEWRETLNRYIVASRAWRATPRNLQAIEPAWSPDGTQLAVTAWSRNMEFNDIFVILLYNHAFQQITDTPNISEYNPSWSPDGKQILFGEINPNTQQPQNARVARFIERGLGLVMQFETTQTANVVSGFPGATFPTWTPDGDVMYYVNSAGGRKRLYTTEPNPDAEDVALNDVELFMEEPRLSPDGEWLVFSSTADTTQFWRSIYIMRTDGTGLRRVTFGNEQGSYRDMSPVWRPS